MVRNFKGVVKVAEVQEEFDNLLNTINAKIDTYNSSLNIEEVDYNNGGAELAPYGYTLSIGGLKKVLDAYDGAILGANVLRISNNQYIVSEGLYIKDRTVTKLPSKVLNGTGNTVYFNPNNNEYSFISGGTAMEEEIPVLTPYINGSDTYKIGTVSEFQPISSAFSIVGAPHSYNSLANNTPDNIALTAPSSSTDKFGVKFNLLLRNEFETVTGGQISYGMKFTQSSTLNKSMWLEVYKKDGEDRQLIYQNSFTSDVDYRESSRTRSITPISQTRNVSELEFMIYMDSSELTAEEIEELTIFIGGIELAGTVMAQPEIYETPVITGSDTSSIGSVSSSVNYGYTLPASYNVANIFSSNIPEWVTCTASQGYTGDCYYDVTIVFPEPFMITDIYFTAGVNNVVAGTLFNIYARIFKNDNNTYTWRPRPIYSIPNVGRFTEDFHYTIGLGSEISLCRKIQFTLSAPAIATDSDTIAEFFLGNFKIVGKRPKEESGGTVLISPINSNRISRLCNRPNATNEEIPDYKVTIESKNSGYVINGNQYLSNSDKGQFYSGSAGRNCRINLFDTQVAYHQWHGDRTDSYHEPFNFMFIPKGIPNPYNGLAGEIRFAMQKVWNYILQRPSR